MILNWCNKQIIEFADSARPGQKHRNNYTLNEYRKSGWVYIISVVVVIFGRYNCQSMAFIRAVWWHCLLPCWSILNGEFLISMFIWVHIRVKIKLLVLFILDCTGYECDHQLLIIVGGKNKIVENFNKCYKSNLVGGSLHIKMNCKIKHTSAFLHWHLNFAVRSDSTINFIYHIWPSSNLVLVGFWHTHTHIKDSYK